MCIQLHSDLCLWDSVLAKVCAQVVLLLAPFIAYSCQGMLEEEYTVSCTGQPDEDLLMLTRLLCSRDKSNLQHCRQPTSVQVLSAKEKDFLKA